MRWTSPSLVNFLAMSALFSINHGTVTGLLAVASANLGTQLAGAQSGTLYIVYTLSALTISAGLVQYFGSQRALFLGLLLYVAYVASFLVVAKVPSVKWFAALLGSTIGGFAAGWIWTAQGTFFGKTAQIIHRNEGGDITKINSSLAAVFSTMYVGMEVLMKIFTSFIEHRAGENALYIIFTIACASSAMGILLIKPVENGDSDEEHFLVAEEKEDREALMDGEKKMKENSFDLVKKVRLAFDLWMREDKMKLLAPLNMSFGFTSSFLSLTVNGKVIKAAVGQDNVGYVAAVSPGVAALLSLPFSWLSGHIGKLPLMIFGALNYAIISFFIMAYSEEELESMRWNLLFLYVLGGVGRAVFESTNKATFADFFPNDLEGAFANVIVQSGSASAFAFFLFAHIDKLAQSLITGITSIIAIFTLILAFRIHRKSHRILLQQISDD